MKYSELNNQLGNKILPVYIVAGEDSYYRKCAQTAILSALNLDKDSFDVNLFGDGDDWGDISIALNTPPFMNDYKLVIWTKTQPFNDENGKKIVKTIGEYLKAPTDYSVLLIVDCGNYAKGLYKLCEIVDCSNADSRDVYIETQRLISEAGYSIEPSALKELTARCDNDMGLIVNELTKLYEYINDKGTIDYQTVDCVVTNSVDYDVFKLTNALGKGMSDDAFNVLASLLAKGESPLGILASITSQYRRMFFASISKLSDDELASQLGVKPYSIKVARSSASAYTQVELKRIMENLQNTEYLCKSGRSDMEEGLYNAVCSLLKRR